MLKALRLSGAWIWMVAIFILSSIPSDNMPDLGFVFSDKLAHFAVYSVLGFLLGWRFGKNKIDGKGVCWRNSFFIGIFYALFDEIHQLFVPGRQFDIWDIAFDIMVVFAGLLFIKSRLSKKEMEE